MSDENFNLDGSKTNGDKEGHDFESKISKGISEDQKVISFIIKNADEKAFLINFIEEHSTKTLCSSISWYNRKNEVDNQIEKLAVHYGNIIQALEAQFKHIEANKTEEKQRILKLEATLEEKERIIEKKDRIIEEKDRENKIEVEKERARYIKLENKLLEKENEFKEEVSKLIIRIDKRDEESKEERNKHDMERALLLKDKYHAFELALAGPSSKHIQNHEYNLEEGGTQNNGLLVSTNVTMEKKKVVVEADEGHSILGVESSKDLKTLSYSSMKLKAQSFLLSSFISLFVVILVGIYMEKEYGIINVIANASKSNHFFICLVSVRYLCHTMGFFMFGKNINDYYIMLYNMWPSLLWISISILSRFVFPVLTGLHFADETSEKFLAPSFTDKIRIVVLMVISNFISNVCSEITFFLLLLKVMLKYCPAIIHIDYSAHIKKNSYQINQIIREAIVDTFGFNLIIWLQFSVVMLIGSISQIPNFNTSLEVFFFGYFMPLLKSSLVSILYNWSAKLAKNVNLTAEKSAKMLSSCCAAGVIVCTLTSLYVIFRGANDPYFFVMQYVPHEIIKRMSWLSYHPFYLKVKLQIVHILEKAYNSACKKKEKVDPNNNGAKPRPSNRRFSMEVMKNMDATAADLLGRQFGEDLCMILIGIWMLPLFQDYFFAPIYRSSDHLPFPTYESAGTMILGLGFGLEFFLTILCFVILQYVGVPLVSNTSAIGFDIMYVGLYVFGISSCLLTVAATFNY